VAVNVAWTWACLVCNEVGNEREIAPQLHRCKEDRRAYFEPVLGYWRYRFGRSRPDLNDAKIDAMLARPVMREAMAEMIGAQWLPTGDVA
jgi:hypothetical protein